MIELLRLQQRAKMFCPCNKASSFLGMQNSHSFIIRTNPCLLLDNYLKNVKVIKDPRQIHEKQNF